MNINQRNILIKNKKPLIILLVVLFLFLILEVLNFFNITPAPFFQKKLIGYCKNKTKLLSHTIIDKKVLYNSIDEAANAWHLENKNHFNNSIISNHETFSYIYEKIKYLKDGSSYKCYGYTPRDVGLPFCMLFMSKEDIPSKSKIVAYIHSHILKGNFYQFLTSLFNSSNENFSESDIKVAHREKIIAYVSTPKGYLKKYLPKNKQNILIK